MLYMYVYTYVICIYIYVYILYVYIYMSIGTMCILYICNRYSEFYMPYSRDALKKELVDSKTGMCVCVGITGYLTQRRFLICSPLIM